MHGYQDCAFVRFLYIPKSNEIGHTFNFQFNPSVPISSDIPGFKKNTQLKDQIHCVCIVIDGSTAGVLPDKLLEKIKAIQMKVHQKSK